MIEPEHMNFLLALCMQREIDFDKIETYITTENITSEEITKTAMLRHAFLDLGMRRIWCGYYDGNTKSRRVQETLGFVYHHTTEGIEVKLMNEIRTGHAMLMTRETWENIRG